MSDISTVADISDTAVQDAVRLFEEAIGVSHVPHHLEDVGNRTFLKLKVGRRASVYDEALHYVQQHLPKDHSLKGLVTLEYSRVPHFPESIEASVLASMLARSTKHVVAPFPTTALRVSYVPFQNHEDDKVIQPASHIIVGRRGVGKSTLISRAVESLSRANKLCVVMDMQPYALSTADTLVHDVIGDLLQRLADAVQNRRRGDGASLESDELTAFSEEVLARSITEAQIGPKLNRAIRAITSHLNTDVFVFLDDFHVIDRELQPRLAHMIYGGLKGAGGWLKVSGLRTLLNYYDPSTHQGLQTPGDAQIISLDLTLVDPRSAETHLAEILERFLEIVGVESTGVVIADAALRRLVWANAGVPRDFLEMIGTALEHSRRQRRAKIALTDANLAIGEFGQRKIDDMERDARNQQGRLRQVVDYLEKFCLDDNKVNAFLVRSENTEERETIQILSDLRIVHLIHSTITPHKAGERYEAYLLDYCFFTGFRRRPNIREMMPEDEEQFKATELRRIPALPRQFLATLEPT